MDSALKKYYIQVGIEISSMLFLNSQHVCELVSLAPLGPLAILVPLDFCKQNSKICIYDNNL